MAKTKIELKDFRNDSPAGAFNPPSTADSGQPDAIRVEIERTRERMEADLEALGNRLDPFRAVNRFRDVFSREARENGHVVEDPLRFWIARVINLMQNHPRESLAIGAGLIVFLAAWRIGTRASRRPDFRELARQGYLKDASLVSIGGKEPMVLIIPVGKK